MTAGNRYFRVVLKRHEGHIELTMCDQIWNKDISLMEAVDLILGRNYLDKKLFGFVTGDNYICGKTDASKPVWYDLRVKQYEE